jgi:hypothetical protein
MRKRWVWTLPALAAASAVMVVLTKVDAADHQDSPGASSDPAADITDVYAWTPAAGRLAMVMNVRPRAGIGARFADKVDYRFAIRNVTALTPGAPGSISVGAAPLDVVCTVVTTAVQKMTCVGPNGLRAEAQVDAVTNCGGADMCLFAGLRSDPAFADLVAVEQAMSGTDGGLAFTDGGANSFARLNVLSIVVELDAVKAFGAGAADGGAPTPYVTVAAETTRRP